MRRSVWIVVAITAALLTGMAVVGTFRFPGTAFDSDRWKNEPRGVRDPIRPHMADRLVARGTLRKMTRQEIIAMLGAPAAQKATSNEQLAFSYFVGPDRGCPGFQSEWLVVQFDVDDRVSAYHLARAHNDLLPIPN